MTKIITKGEYSDKAFVLQSGNITVEVIPEIKFDCSGQIIFGGGELVSESMDYIPVFRPYSVYTGDGTEYREIKKDRLLKMVSSYNVGYNISKFMANNILNFQPSFLDMNKKLGDNEKKITKYFMIYASVVDEIEKVFNEKRYPWLESIVKESKKSLMYTKGKAFLATQVKQAFKVESDTLDDFTKRFAPGSYVCKQGEDGHEMYILKQGRLKVLINDVELDVIDKQGSVIGEMALLLGEKRTASLIASEDSILTVISDKNLEDVANSDKKFFPNMVSTLSKREVSMCQSMVHLKELLDQQDTNQSAGDVLKLQEYRDEIKKIVDKLKDINRQQDMDWMKTLITDTQEKLREVS